MENVNEISNSQKIAIKNEIIKDSQELRNVTDVIDIKKVDIQKQI